MKFQVLMAVGMKMTVFWDVVLCSLVHPDFPMHTLLITSMMEAVNTSEM
jgi:hypothetical protein